MAGMLGARTKPRYEVFAVHYATVPDFAAPGLVAGPRHRVRWRFEAVVPGVVRVR